MDINGIRYLKLAGLHGANANGKSNLIKALAYFKEMVTNSIQAEGFSVVVVNPFRQSKERTSKPSYFQIILLLDDDIILTYRSSHKYNFE